MSSKQLYKVHSAIKFLTGLSAKELRGGVP
jgi:hypothetical protein